MLVDYTIAVGCGGFYSAVFKIDYDNVCGVEMHWCRSSGQPSVLPNIDSSVFKNLLNTWAQKCIRKAGCIFERLNLMILQTNHDRSCGMFFRSPFFALF